MKLADLRPNPKNPRKISDEQMKRLRKSLAEFGDLSGIVFNRTTGHLVGGHQRLKALPPDAEIVREGSDYGHVVIDGQRFTYREVEWDETKEKAANIAANKHGGEWDLPALNDWLLELDAANIDMDLTGFSPEELENLMAPTQVAGQCDEDDVPEAPAEPKTKLGDVYQLGRHRLMCGDSASMKDLDALLGAEIAEMVFTDPPYGIGVDGQKESVAHNPKHSRKGHEFRGWDAQRPDAGVFNYIVALGVPAVIFGGNYFADLLPASRGWIYWGKGQDGDLTASDGELAWTNLDKPLRAVTVNRSALRGSVHPTQKPLEVVEFCLDYVSKEAKTVLDLFAGSGSTLIACEKTGRTCFMMELDPRYCDVIVARWEKYTGQKAQLLTDGGPSDG